MISANEQTLHEIRQSLQHIKRNRAEHCMLLFYEVEHLCEQLYVLDQRHQTELQEVKASLEAHSASESVVSSFERRLAAVKELVLLIRHALRVPR